MLFDGFSLHLTAAPDNVEGHPFHAANNVNGIGITSIVDYQVLPLDPRVQALQEAYIRKVVDTVHDLPNVLYEVANESSGRDGATRSCCRGWVGHRDARSGDSTQWQYWVIDIVKDYEQERGYDAHPIGMTMQFPVADQSMANEPLLNSPADWISPGFDDTMPDGRWSTDPPANEGTKVVLLIPTTFRLSPATPCGSGRRSSAAITRSCTTWGSWVAACRRTRPKECRPSTPWSPLAGRWERPGGSPKGSTSGAWSHTEIWRPPDTRSPTPAGSTSCCNR